MVQGFFREMLEGRLFAAEESVVRWWLAGDDGTRGGSCTYNAFIKYRLCLLSFFFLENILGRIYLLSDTRLSRTPMQIVSRDV